jgi:hypothetical protein
VAQGADGAMRRYDDHRVSRLPPPPAAARDAPPAHLASASAYLLFYLRRGDD